jgi:hypothetical protein
VDTLRLVVETQTLALTSPSAEPATADSHRNTATSEPFGHHLPRVSRVINLNNTGLISVVFDSTLLGFNINAANAIVWN